jgi:hypothetical protein
MVSNLITRLLVGFRTDWPRCEEAMKTAGRETQNRYAIVRSQTEHMGRKARTNPAQSCGLESEKKSGHRRCIFLDFPFYRTYQEFGAWGTPQLASSSTFCTSNETNPGVP